MKNIIKPKVTQKAFTLIEVMVAGTMITTLGFALLGLQDLFFQNEQTAFNTYTNVSETNRVLTQFIKEMRQIQMSENGAYALDTLNDNEIVFYSDYDNDDTVERVRYTLNANVLEKGITEPAGSPAVYDTLTETTRILTENVVNQTPIFSYYNSDWPSDLVNNPLVSGNRFSDTQTIRIFLLVNSNLNQDGEEYVLDSFVQPRILKSNL